MQRENRFFIVYCLKDICTVYHTNLYTHLAKYWTLIQVHNKFIDKSYQLLCENSESKLMVQQKVRIYKPGIL